MIAYGFLQIRDINGRQAVKVFYTVWYIKLLSVQSKKFSLSIPHLLFVRDLYRTLLLLPIHEYTWSSKMLLSNRIIKTHITTPYYFDTNLHALFHKHAHMHTGVCVLRLRLCNTQRECIHSARGRGRKRGAEKCIDGHAHIASVTTYTSTLLKSCMWQIKTLITYVEICNSRIMRSQIQQ